jgi:hypothetical protein
MRQGNADDEEVPDMPVERRYSDRLVVDFEVELRFRGHRLPPARARDLSPEGLRLTVPGVAPPSGALLEVSMHRRGRDWTLRGIVVHATADSVGLMFCDPRPELYRAEQDAPNRAAPAAPGWPGPNGGNWPRAERL